MIIKVIKNELCKSVQDLTLLEAVDLYCPSRFGLNNSIEICNDAENNFMCEICWLRALDDIDNVISLEEIDLEQINV